MAHKIIIDAVIGFEYTAQDFRTELNKAKGKDVEIDISSPGGEVYNGFNIYNLIKNYKGKTTVNIQAHAASAASYIAIAADEVTATKSSTFMIHNAGTFSGGDHNDLRKTANKLERISETLVEAYAKKTGQTKEDIRAYMDEETDFYGQEIVDAGFADRIIDSELEEVARDDAILNMLISVEACNNLMKEQDQNSNIDKAVAMTKSTKAPVAKTKTPKENMSVDLKAPEVVEAIAKAVAEAKEVEAKVEETVAEVEEPKTASDKAMDILASASYPDSVKAVAKKVLKGEQTQENLDAIVAMADMIAESKNSEAAQEESGTIGETPAHQQPVSNLVDGKAVNMAGIKEIAAKLKNAQTKSEDK